MRGLASEPETTKEREAMCQWLLESKAEGDLVNPDRWFLEKIEYRRDQATLEFRHAEGHEMTMTIQMVNGVKLIESASYSVTVANRLFDMDTGERIVKSTYTGEPTPRAYKAKRQVEPAPAYKSSDPNWGAW